MESFSGSLSSSMEQSFLNIQEMIDTRISARMSNDSFSAPSHPPVRMSSNQGQQDPSQPRVRRCDRHRPEAVDPEGVESIDSPNVNVMSNVCNESDTARDRFSSQTHVGRSESKKSRLMGSEFASSEWADDSVNLGHHLRILPRVSPSART